MNVQRRATVADSFLRVFRNNCVFITSFVCNKKLFNIHVEGAGRRDTQRKHTEMKPHIPFAYGRWEILIHIIYKRIHKHPLLYISRHSRIH